MVKEKLNRKDQVKYDKKLEKLRQEHEARIERWTRTAVDKSKEKPIEAEWLAYCINEAADENTIFLSETVTNSGAIHQMVSTHQPGTFFSNGGACLGWSMGASLGAKLAAPDKTVINLIGDGGFLFGLPIATLWAAQRQNAPFLTIIFDNKTYNAPKQTLKREYKESNNRYKKYIKQIPLYYLAKINRILRLSHNY